MTVSKRALLTGLLAAVVLSGGMAGHAGARDERKTKVQQSARKAPAAPPLAEAEGALVTGESGVAEPCISVDFIRSTKVLDDRTVRFRMTGGAMYEIKLRDRCFGLAFHESFYYQASPTRQLCARYDTIVARSGSRCRIDSITRLNRKPDEKGGSRPDKR